MQAEIITIGDEILIGQIVDTNSAWLGEKLNAAGIRIHRITSVSDTARHIEQAVGEALKRSDVVICTGGLGRRKTTSRNIRSHACSAWRSCATKPSTSRYAG